jgi:hypothetical protein
MGQTLVAESLASPTTRTILLVNQGASGGLKIYENGTLVHTGHPYGILAESGLPHGIFANTNINTSACYNAQLLEFGYWPRAVSDAERATIDTCIAPSGPKTWLIMGQSNANGSGTSATAPAGMPTMPMPGTREWISFGTGTPVADQRVFGAVRYAGDTSFGPEVGIAKALLDAGKPANFIKATWNGTSVSSWASEAGTCSAFAAESICDAIQSYGASLDIAGIVWVQGETDAQTLSSATNYATNMATFAAFWRYNLNKPTLPIVLNRLNANASLAVMPYRDTLRTSQETFAGPVGGGGGGTDSYAYLIDSDSCELKSDGTHYTSQGILDLGYSWLGPKVAALT